MPVKGRFVAAVILAAVLAPVPAASTHAQLALSPRQILVASERAMEHTKSYYFDVTYWFKVDPHKYRSVGKYESRWPGRSRETDTCIKHCRGRHGFFETTRIGIPDGTASVAEWDDGGPPYWCDNEQSPIFAWPILSHLPVKFEPFDPAAYLGLGPARLVGTRMFRGAATWLIRVSYDEHMASNQITRFHIDQWIDIQSYRLVHMSGAIKFRHENLIPYSSGSETASLSGFGTPAHIGPPANRCASG